MQFREAHGGKITAITCGSESAEDILRKALALRADEAVLIASPAAHPDPLFVAKTLAAAIRKIGSFDVVLVGREAGDWGSGQTGGLLAEELGIPCISFAESFEPAAGALKSPGETPNRQRLGAARIGHAAGRHDHKPRTQRPSDSQDARRDAVVSETADEMELG